MTPLCSGRGAASCEPSSGASIAFADPDQNALEAEVFWRTEDYRRIVSAYVRGSEDRGLGVIVSLNEVPCRKTLLKTVDGEQHLLLRDRRRVAQIRCIGDDIRVDPFALELVVDRFPDVDAPQRLIKRLADLYRGKRIGGPRGDWTVEAMRHHDALAALDRRIEGHSYRQIAVFLYGEKAVKDDWNNPDQTMKNRVIRSVKRGFHMMNGGYRALLA